MTNPQHHDIVVIGAGICGSTISHELLARNQSVCIVDAGSSPASACSSHAYAIAHPHIGKGSPRLLRLTRLAFLLAEARWGTEWRAHGIFQPTKKEKVFNRTELIEHLTSLGLGEDIAIPLDVEQARKICGIPQSGVWISRGACLDLSKTTKNLLTPHQGLSYLWNTEVVKLEQKNDKWLLLGADESVIACADKVVIAAALESKKLLSSIGVRMPLKPVRGQLSIFSIQANDPWVARLPKVGLSGDGYCLPAELLDDGSYRWIVGSSFDEGEDDLAPRDTSDDFNREQAKNLVNFLEGDTGSLTKHDHFVGVRCVAGDRLPIIGALPHRPGIFVATALGSRGILWSALAAKLITAQLLSDDFALLARLGFAADLVAALAPARFLAGALAAPGALASNSNPILPSAPRAK
jgi:tRNA 5-methylaminomethyl-2-thiouridine biosynthesis bifunctional protein